MVEKQQKEDIWKKLTWILWGDQKGKGKKRIIYLNPDTSTNKESFKSEINIFTSTLLE